MRNQSTTIQVVLAVAAVAIVSWFTLVRPSQNAANEALCRSNLVKLYHALVSYDSVKGALPPAYTVNIDGKPTHSWRALVMPHLDALGIDEEAFYAKYNFGQRWDSLDNLKLIATVKERPINNFRI